MAMSKKLEELLLESIQDAAEVAPSMFLNLAYQSLIPVMRFIEATPSATYAGNRLRKLFKTKNWVLDAQLLDGFFQLAGEVQFWMLAQNKGVMLERIPEEDKKTADLRMAGTEPGLPQFEVKTLSVSSGGWMHLAKMAEDSFQAQLDLQAKRSSGTQLATSTQSISPHGDVECGHHQTTMCKNLINKATGNIKAGQYAAAPTFLVLNLILIDSYYNGTTDLRPVAAGYPDPWSVRTGVLWTTAFGTLGQIVHGLPEFEGKPGIEGFLGLEGVLTHPHFRELAGLLMVVHPMRKEPNIYGLMRTSDMDRFSSNNQAVISSFMSLVGEQWNDELDCNGPHLTQH